MALVVPMRRLSAPAKIVLGAIAAKRRLSFTYNGRRRVVEPQCLGLTATRAETLRAYQLSGGAVEEPLFTLSKMSDLVALEEHFERPGPNYKKGDAAMKEIYGEL